MTMDKAGEAILAIVSGVIGLAIVAVLVSKNAQTPNVVSAAATALAKVIGAAVAPVASGGVLGTGFGGIGGIGGAGSPL